MVLKVFKLSLVNLQARLMSVSISSNTKLSITDNVRSKASNMHKVLTHTTDPHRQPAVRRADRLFSSHHPCYPPVPADLRSGSVLKTQKSHCIHFTSNMKHCNKSKNDRKALLQKKRNSKKCREKKRKARARAILLRPYWTRNRGARVSISGWREVSPGWGGKFPGLRTFLWFCSHSARKSIGPSLLWNARKSTCIRPSPYYRLESQLFSTILNFLSHRKVKARARQETKRRFAIVVLRTDSRRNHWSRCAFHRLPLEFAYEPFPISKVTSMAYWYAIALNNAGMSNVEIGKQFWT